MIRNEKGFTLIEIIAVLVILGILAAVAVPKYINMAAEAKISAARGQLAEVKSTLNLAYARNVMKQNTTPTTPPDAAAIIAEAVLVVGNNVFGTAPDDWQVTLAAAGQVVTITVTARGTDTGYATSPETWTVPTS